MRRWVDTEFLYIAQRRSCPSPLVPFGHDARSQWRAVSEQLVVGPDYDFSASFAHNHAACFLLSGLFRCSANMNYLNMNYLNMRNSEPVTF